MEGGTNDIASNAPLGDVTDGYGGVYDTSTFAGALEDAFSRIRTKWMSAKVLFVRVHNMASRDAEKQVLYGKMALKVCEKWAIKAVDIYSGGGLNTNIPGMAAAYTSNADATHPNSEGYDLFYINPVTSALVTI